MHSDHGFYGIQNELSRRLQESAPGRVQILTGPRQVGKTTLLLELARQWGESSLYLPADAPEASLSGWWHLQWQKAFQRSRSRQFLLLIDEVQYLPDWSRLVKTASDQAHREKLPLHIVITGSAALTIGTGARETMAGRFERLVLRQWEPRDLATAFKMTQEQAVMAYIRFGSFPGSMNLLPDIPRWRSYIRESIIEPAIGRDILMLETVRKPGLLRQIFSVSAGHPGEILSLAKIAGNLSEKGTLETISHYLRVLEQAYLVSPIRKHSSKEIRLRSSPPKLIPMSNAFLAGTHGESPPDSSGNRDLWGRWLENACIAFAVAQDQGVSYWREEPLEVDAIIAGSWGKLAVEIKSGPYTPRDLAGLIKFHDRWPEYRPLVICSEEHISIARAAGIDAMSWKEYLWEGVRA